ncbi:glycosyltransferase family 39 protein [Sphingomonas sp. SRS2]|uniref:glycosyltransferase family 39 protein n=1 Tax=Sphingomonas sp. SRS2 TaxID=133190 RepID=UPI0009FFE354|nr:glycosyltransferase family 39 protein [Sphingomonas sp. SRS2]
MSIRGFYGWACTSTIATGAAGRIWHKRPTMIRALSPRYHFAAAAAVIALAALAARAWGMWAEPMWLDEGYSAYAASKGWAFLWQVVPRYETHPPFYYSLLRVWTLIAGDGLVAHRMLGLICGMATLPVVALAARRLARLTGASPAPVMLTALALTAVSPILVEMTREIRPYPLMILVYAAATLALLVIAERRADGLPLAGRAFAAYLACTALMLWLHNLGPLYAAALGLALLCVARARALTKADWLWLLGGHAIVIALWSPALFILLDQAPMWVKATWLKWSTVDLWRRATVLFAGPSDDMRIAAAILALFGGAVLLRAREGWRLLAVLLLLGGLPIAVSLIVSATVAPVFIIRTMTPLAIPAILLMACATGWAWRRYGWLAPLAALIWITVAQGHFDLRARQHIKRDWYRTMEWLSPRFRPGDMVFAYPNEGALPFDRAVRDYRLAMPSRPIPTAIPSLNPPPGSWYVSGSRGVPSLARAHLRMIAQEPATQAVPTIWLLRLGPWAYDKGDVFLEELSKGRVEVGRFKDGAIDIVGLRQSALIPVTPAKAGVSGGAGAR